MADMTNIGILISSRGSNMLAIADSITAGRIPNARIAVVFSDNADAAGLEAAKAKGLQAYAIPRNGISRKEHERELVAGLHRYDVQLVCLAGYMRVLSSWFLDHGFLVLNIHPSLLPAFPGEHAQQQAIEHGVKVAGCTVHIATEELDAGPIIVQRPVEVLDDDTEETLSDRILKQEWIAYTEAINMILSGDYQIVGRRHQKKRS